MRYLDRPEIIDGYYQNLLAIIDGSDSGYDKLLMRLYYKTFVVVVEDDTNRVSDGVDLRDEYLYYEGIGGFRFDMDCTVLEVLVALARRYDRMINDPDVDRTDEYFWMFLRNLGLTEFSDRDFDVDKVDEILENWMLRSYKKNGNGGIFPIKNCKEDLRKIGLIAQMYAYMGENE